MFADRNSRRQPDQRPPRVNDVIAGWRLVRELGGHGREEPRRSEVNSAGRGRSEEREREFVGVCSIGAVSGTVGSEHWQDFGHTERPELLHRRIVVAVGSANAASIAQECALRDTIASDFVELADETLVEGHVRIAVFPLRHRRQWSELVTNSIELSAGSAVTLLVPVVETVQLAHAAGIVHGGLDLTACFVDGQGKPWLEGWGSAVRVADLSSVRADLAVAADLRALGKIVDVIIARCAAPIAEDLSRLVAALVDGVTPSDATARLIDALFKWAEPEPVPSFEMSAANSAGHGTTGTTGTTRAASTPVNATRDGDDSAADDTEVETLLPPTSVRDATAPSVRVRSRLRAMSGYVSEFAGRVRPAIWGAATAVGAVLALAGGLLLSVDASEAGQTSATHEVEVDVEGAAAEEAAAEEAAAVPDATEEAGRDGPTGTTASEPPPGSTESASPELGLDAVPELVAARDECIREADTECVAALYSEAAPGLEQELAILSAEDTVETWLIGEGAWVLAADLGDIELIRDESGGVSLSIERTQSGWLLREVWFVAAT